MTTPPRVTIPAAESALVSDLARHAGLLVANARLTTELAREVDLVTEQAAELLRSRQLVVAAQDAERQRLERDIHDGAQQELVATLIQIRSLGRAAPARPDDDDPRALAAVRESVQRARATMEELCRGGRPEVLARGGLSVALDAAAETARRAGLAVEVACELDHRLPPETEAAIYFCCLEALQNSAKHAHASRVVVEVVATGDEVTLLVRDDGVGFEPSRSVPGSGLRNLLERSAVLGGTAAVDSAPNAGTTTTVRVPLQAFAGMSGTRP
jgi:signal transduction histidine kinase